LEGNPAAPEEATQFGAGHHDAPRSQTARHLAASPEPDTVEAGRKVDVPELAQVVEPHTQSHGPSFAVTTPSPVRHSSSPSNGEDNKTAQASAAAPPFDGASVAAAKRGEPSAWAAAYLAYGQALMGFLMVRLGNQDDAAEALSETFTRAIDKASSFRGDAYAFRAWLFSIARNVSADQGRHRARVLVLPDQPDAADRLQPSGEDRAILAEDVLALRRGFALLSRVDQEVLWLRVCSGLSAAEVGEVMGKRAGAVRMQQMRALESLRSQVQS
jgi:RNA polymerase sigma-70 factor (ECF subfamily)